MRGYKSELLKTWNAFLSYIRKEKLQYADQEKEIEQLSGFDIPELKKTIDGL